MIAETRPLKLQGDLRARAERPTPVRPHWHCTGSLGPSGSVPQCQAEAEWQCQPEFSARTCPGEAATGTGKRGGPCSDSECPGGTGQTPYDSMDRQLSKVPGQCQWHRARAQWHCHWHWRWRGASWSPAACQWLLQAAC